MHGPPLEVALDAIIQGPPIYAERHVDDRDRLVDRVVIMGVAHHERRRQEPAPDRLLKEEGAERLGRLAVDVARGIDEVTRTPEELEVPGQPMPLDRLPDALGKPRPLAVQTLDDVELVDTPP